MRDEADEFSDVDLLFAHRRPFGLLEVVRVTRRISELLDGARVDLVPCDSILPELRDPISREAIRVF